MTHASPSLIHTLLHDDLWHITLARPQQRNALTPEMLTDLLQAIQNTPAAARTLLLDGDGKTFCAGFDLERSQGQAGIEVVRALLIGLSAVVQALSRLHIPVVMAVQGAAIAGGCALLGGADAVVTHAEAQFGYPAARLGLSPAVSAPTLAQHIGSGPARALQLDGGLISGQRAYAIGLATHLSDRDALLHTALSVATQLAAKPPAALAHTRHLLQSLTPALQPESGLLQAALDASLHGTGSDEQISLLAKAWSMTRSKTDQNRSSQNPSS
jgi:enoyl-CoA hydratase/carnithine racemase